jgi:hypothetical protein
MKRSRFTEEQIIGVLRAAALTKTAGTEKRRSTEQRNAVTVGATETQDSTSEWREVGAQVKFSSDAGVDGFGVAGVASLSASTMSLSISAPACARIELDALARRSTAAVNKNPRQVRLGLFPLRRNPPIFCPSATSRLQNTPA